MRHALALAARGLGQVWPNPSVGCIIVRENRVLGRGWTQPGGRPHAETMALAQAGSAARGATAFVTLEPCSHHGKTPPCADALIEAGITRVVCPLEDPDPRVAGKGFKRLQEAGCRVDIDASTLEEAITLNTGFLLHRTLARPTVTLKLATSLDGKIAMASGESRWITGVAARRRVHLLRAQHDAVLVGSGTSLADDPLLDVRDLGLTSRSPVRVVADSRLTTPLTGRLAQSAARHPLWLIHASHADRQRQKAWKDLGATLIQCPQKDAMLDPSAMLKALAKHGITRVFCEGGSKLATTLLRSDLVDRLIHMQAGIMLGRPARSALEDLGFEHLTDVARFRLAHAQTLGNDLWHEWLRDPICSAPEGDTG